jgi:hypothetical protein
MLKPLLIIIVPFGAGWIAAGKSLGSLGSEVMVLSSCVDGESIKPASFLETNTFTARDGIAKERGPGSPVVQLPAGNAAHREVDNSSPAQPSQQGLTHP